jgi:hypothetical protein
MSTPNTATPLTDAAIDQCHGIHGYSERTKSLQYVDAAFARTLETQLADLGNKNEHLENRLHVLSKKLAVCESAYRDEHSQKEPASITHLELLPNQELVDRLTQLDALQPGWFDGEGVVPDSSLVSWLAENLSDSYPEGIAFPHVAALPEGGVYFEWITDDSRTTAEIRNGGFYADLHSTRLATGESVANRLDLNSGNGVDALFAFVREQGGTIRSMTSQT